MILDKVIVDFKIDHIAKKNLLSITYIDSNTDTEDTIKGKPKNMLKSFVKIVGNKIIVLWSQWDREYVNELLEKYGFQQYSNKRFIVVRKEIPKYRLFYSERTSGRSTLYSYCCTYLSNCLSLNDVKCIQAIHNENQKYLKNVLEIRKKTSKKMKQIIKMDLNRRYGNVNKKQ